MGAMWIGIDHLTKKILIKLIDFKISKIGKQQVLGLALIKELGLELYDQYDEGKYTFVDENNQITHYEPYNGSNDALFAIDILSEKAQKMAESLSEEGFKSGKVKNKKKKNQINIKLNKKKKWREDERKMDEISFKEWLTENEKEQGVGKSGSLMTGNYF